MTIEADIVTSFSAHGGLTALIGSGAACRLYSAPAPEDVTYPCVEYQRIASTYEQAFGTGEPVAARHPVFQFTAWVQDRDTHLNARAIATQIEAAALALVGSTVSVYSVSLLGRSDGVAQDGQLRRVDVDVEVVHS